jgi:hypothetical protein
MPSASACLSCLAYYRKRLLRKFEENDCEKVERLVDLHMIYLERVNNITARATAGE